MPTQPCLRFSVITLLALARLCAEPVPYPTLNPPAGISPAMTRQWFPWSCGTPTDPRTLPKQTWTPEQRQAYETRVKWFHDAKYRTVDGTTTGPCLEIQENQLEQLRAVRDALKDIPPTDGAAMAPSLNGARKNTEK